MEYALNYIVTDLSQHAVPPYIGRGWSVSFGPLEAIGLRSSQFSTHYGSHVEMGKVVLINAPSFQRALAVSRLIHAAHCVLDGSNVVHEFANDLELIPYLLDENPMNEHVSGGDMAFASKNTKSCPDTPLACRLAAKASFLLSRQYALFKLYHSYRQHSMWFTDLDPSHSGILPKSSMIEDHIAFAQAITLAYGVIEELGLEVRASAKQPSRSGCGVWNSDVKRDLEERLAKAHIDINRTFDWDIRGPKTRLEKGRKTKPLGRASWAYGMVRSVEVQLIDAIADLSWLRSCIAAHRFSDHKEGNLVSLLSPYEVSNAQLLARRLILESMGFWEHWRDPQNGEVVV